MMSMDEHSSGGLPWLDMPVMFHSSRADTCKMTPEQCAYRSGYWRYWYEADHVYSLNTIYFLCATTGFFTIIHFLSKYAPIRAKRSRIWRKTTAVGRYLAYKGYQLPAIRYCSPSLGVILLGIIGTVFCVDIAMTLGPKPYYWPNTKDGTISYGNSPPIATRTGWMALALLPFVLALGAKANLISALTGVPHEKLQVYHHWTSYAMFVLALIHTFPFIVFNIWRGQMVTKWDTSLVYWTGVATLIPQAYLTFMSLPSIRNRYYEFFKATHFLVALLFLLFFFFHCDFRLTSWDYFVAAGAIYLFSLCAAWIRTHLINGRHTATVDILPCGFIRIRIPTVMSWRPGQHVFIRFLSPQLGLHCLTAHPFTICSLSHDPDKVGRASEMVFYVKPHHGITARLATKAAQTPAFSQTVLLEGPYGGISGTASPAEFDTVLVITGGSGGGFSLAIVEEALRIYGDMQPDHQECNIQVVFATRDNKIASWYREEIEDRVSVYDVDARTLSVSIHDTSPEHAQLPMSAASGAKDPSNEITDEVEVEPAFSEKGSNADQQHLSTVLHGPRPNLPQIVNAATSAGSNRRIAIFACGPASMLHDVRNAAAEAQKRALRGGAEVYLHTESFS
ncbi:ferric reductase like transmembrane component-domain-containing protein [Aspergillus bertholletiae]|uniref:ferric-chelate reductase (NADPH) n=1 Tax=Aspergillus bertholletiae TaxID=1226010 RepID=A0A5N7ARQ6_9EURO|nr:ferric reductase like transmembrane component-domain-containing protein [Aspergillus bertholletiae]